MTDGGRGLEGVNAALSAVSAIIDDTLTYRGYDIGEVAERSSFAEVAYLLWHGELPSGTALAAFKHELRLHRTLPDGVTRRLGPIAAGGNLMAALRAAVSSLALHPAAGETRSEREEAVAHLAAFPTVVAHVYRAGRGSALVPPDTALDEAANFLFMLRGSPPSALHARALDTVLVVHADHELNASTFAARVAASTRASLNAAVVAALATLEGPLHGGASARVADLLDGIGDESQVERRLDELQRAGTGVPGFGHRVYRAGDPRARILKSVTAALAAGSGDTRRFDLAGAVEASMLVRTGSFPSVDFYAACVYHYLGLPASLFAPVFALGRMSGWIAHILEQYGNNRLIRPRAEYVGVGRRPYVPLQER